MTGFGQYTMIDLSNVRELMDVKATGYSRDAGRFALELAATAKDYRVRNWLNAGWTDVTLQVDRRLLSGMSSVEKERALSQDLRNTLTPIVARGYAAAYGPVYQAHWLLNQLEDKETGKAIVMVRPISDGRFLVAIGFAGTGARLYDWLTNMQFERRDGFHAGFQSLVDQFMSNAHKISFPFAAEQLGRENLTLRDIFDEMRSPDSRFRVFAAGHSQGAAVLQVWMHRMIHEEKALPQYILGYGFGTPSVAISSFEASVLPVTLVNNSDDVFSRMGLYKHLGDVYVYRADNALRERCYENVAESDLFRSMMSILSEIQTTAQGLFSATAFMYALSYIGEKEAHDVLSNLVRIMPYLGEARSRTMILLLRRFFRQNYIVATGEEPNEDTLLALAKSYFEAIRRLGAAPVSQALFEAIMLPHHLVIRDKKSPCMSAYEFITVRGYDKLVKTSV